MERLKEYKWFIIGFGIITIAALYAVSTSKTLKAKGQYSVGKITKIEKDKNTSIDFKYEFKLFGEIHKGYLSDMLINGRDHHLKKGERYIVIYNPDRPKENVLLPHRPIFGEINLDSLNELGVDPSDFNWWDM